MWRRYTSGHTHTLACLVPLCSSNQFTFCCHDVIIVFTMLLLMTLTSVLRPAGSIIPLRWLASGLVWRPSSRHWQVPFLGLTTWRGHRSLTSNPTQPTWRHCYSLTEQLVGVICYCDCRSRHVACVESSNDHLNCVCLLSYIWELWFGERWEHLVCSSIVLHSSQAYFMSLLF